MARSYTLRGLTAANGLALVNVWCRAYNATTDALVETAYTDSSGEASFTALPDDANVNICCIPGVKGDQVTWLYNVFSAAQDLSYGEIITQSAQVKDAIIINAKIGLLAVDTAQIADAAVENAKIANATILDAKISTCSIGKLTAGNLTVLGTITGSGGFQTAAAGNNRIVINTSYVAGYNSANALQFYLQASDGKAYAGAGSIVLDSGGIVVYGQLLKFYSGATYVGVAGAYSTTAMWMGAVAGDLSLLSNGVIYAGRSIYPSATTYDLGDATYYWDDVNYTDLIDRASAKPVFNSYTDVIRGIKTKKRKVTIEEAEDEGMGKRTIERIKRYGEEIEEFDLNSFPEEMLIRPTQEDYDKAEERYKEFSEYRGEGWETLLPVKKLTPKIGKSLSDLVYTLLRSHQELLERVDSLEAA